MDRKTAVLAYKTGIISLGEAMSILVPDIVHFGVKQVYLQDAYRQITGEDYNLPNGQRGYTLAFIQACGARRAWIVKQQNSLTKQE